MFSSDANKPAYDAVSAAQQQAEDEKVSMESSLEDGLTKGPPPDNSFPEGGPRAWAVAVASSMALFSTFGYGNAFG